MTTQSPTQRAHTSDETTLWCVHVQGPDTMIAMPDRATADMRAAEWNAMFAEIMARDPHPYDPVMHAEVVVWDGGYETWRAEIDEHGGNPEDIC